jgi:hypothetical protein
VPDTPNKPGMDVEKPLMAGEMTERTNQEKYSQLMAISTEQNLGLIS